jgi:hypothetical protein
MNIYWTKKFIAFNKKYWGGALKSIPVYVKPMDENYGEYYHPNEDWPDEPQRIILDQGMKHRHKENVLLHEMAHHAVFEKYGNASYHHHCSKWKKEMRRCGFTGKINKDTAFNKRN